MTDGDYIKVIPSFSKYFQTLLRELESPFYTAVLKLKKVTKKIKNLLKEYQKNLHSFSFSFSFMPLIIFCFIKKFSMVFLFIVCAIVEAKVCSRGCYASYNGMAYGYAWNVPAGGSCAGGPAIGSTVYWAEADPNWNCQLCGGSTIVDSGVIENFEPGDMNC